jgi:hypothetical protein
MHLAYDDPDPKTPIPPYKPVNVPLNQIQNTQPSQQASSSSNRGRGKRKASEQNGPDENSTVNWENLHLYLSKLKSKLIFFNSRINRATVTSS